MSWRAWTFLWLLVLAWFLVNQASAATIFPSQYDGQIQSSVKLYWAAEYPDWRSGKAQLFAESRLDPNAVSQSGAAGVAQFMGPTFAEVTKQLGFGVVSPKLSKYAIPAYAYYMAKIRHGWSPNRPIEDREDLTRASYNAGSGWLIEAQKLCGGSALYADIIPCLPMVTGGANASQTANYVKHIHQYRAMME